MNRLNKERTSKERIKTSDNKSDIYLSNFVANFYNDLEERTYKETIRVEQVNFNAYYCKENKLISRLDFEFVDLNYLIIKNGIKSHLLYLPRLRDLCYNQREEIYKDFALLLCNSYEEMEEVASGNKEREEVVRFIKSLGADNMFIDESIKREYERIDAEMAKEEEIAEAVKKATKKAKKQGLEQGIEQGEKKNKIEMIKALYSNGVSIDAIAKSAILSIDDVKQILKNNIC